MEPLSRAPPLEEGPRRGRRAAGAAKKGRRRGQRWEGWLRGWEVWLRGFVGVCAGVGLAMSALGLPPCFLGGIMWRFSGTYALRLASLLSWMHFGALFWRVCAPGVRPRYRRSPVTLGQGPAEGVRLGLGPAEEALLLAPARFLQVAPVARWEHSCRLDDPRLRLLWKQQMATKSGRLRGPQLARGRWSSSRRWAGGGPRRR